MDKAAQRYLKYLRRSLVCAREDRERLLRDARDMLENFSQENPGAFYQSYTDSFGPPEDFAAEMLSSLDPEDVAEARQRRRRTLAGALAVAAAFLVLLAGFWFGRRSQPPVEPAPPSVESAPVAEVTAAPTAEPTPTVEASPDPTVEPTPTAEPSPDPTAEPTPTTEPTPAPTAEATPTPAPTPPPESRPPAAGERTADTYLEGLYTDAEDITYREAVAVLTELGLMSGNEEGEFHPANTVTRAECAKLFALVMCGGSDCNTGVKGEPSFSDIQGNWAETYIEYCFDLGIVFPSYGDDDGSFRPGEAVTGFEFLRMALCTLGYDADAYRLRDKDWVIRTDERARTLAPSLYEGLSGTAMSEAVTREEVAQILYNALRAVPRRVMPSQNVVDGTVIWQYVDATKKDGTPATLLWERFELDPEEISFE